MRDEGEDQDLDSTHHSSSQITSSRGEFDFIKRLRQRALRRRVAINDAHPSSLHLGIGDDAAVIRQYAGRDTIITTDLLVEEIDFRRDAMPPRLLGHKALAVSLSDVAAMGARPRWALLSIGVPRDVWDSPFLDQFYEGFFTLAGRYDVTLIGGDVSRTPERVVIDSIVVGETARGHAILRAGARPGDHIFVTGTLGGAAAGLRLILGGARLTKGSGRQRDTRTIEQLLLRQLRPEPRVGWGMILGKERLATALIDLSDGLSSDLAHLCDESGTGALIEASRIPIDPLLVEVCEQEGLDPYSLALHGGEDFELLFTVRPRNLARLPKRIGGVPVTYIGDVTDRSKRLRILERGRARALRPAGFSHFDRES